jgi:hypothetical protein
MLYIQVDGAKTALYFGYEIYRSNKPEHLRSRLPRQHSCFSTAAPAQTPNRQTAILVEADATPTCAGLDCPPWRVAPDFDVCLKADQKFYSGSYHTWKARAEQL